MAAGIAIAAIFLAISTAVTLTILYKAHKDLTKPKKRKK
jgi:hypothetical protein